VVSVHLLFLRCVYYILHSSPLHSSANLTSHHLPSPPFQLLHIFPYLQTHTHHTSRYIIRVCRRTHTHTHTNTRTSKSAVYTMIVYMQSERSTGERLSRAVTGCSHVRARVSTTVVVYNNNAFVSRLQYVNPGAAISPNHVVYYRCCYYYYHTRIRYTYTHTYVLYHYGHCCFIIIVIIYYPYTYYIVLV